MQVDDLRLLGIPRSRPKIARADPKHGETSEDCPSLSTKVLMLVELTSVARVSLRTSKGHHRPVFDDLPFVRHRIVPLRSCDFR